MQRRDRMHRRADKKRGQRDGWPRVTSLAQLGGFLSRRCLLRRRWFALRNDTVKASSVVQNLLPLVSAADQFQDTLAILRVRIAGHFDLLMGIRPSLSALRPWLQPLLFLTSQLFGRDLRPGVTPQIVATGFQRCRQGLRFIPAEPTPVALQNFLQFSVQLLLFLSREVIWFDDPKDDLIVVRDLSLSLFEARSTPLFPDGSHLR